MPGERSLGRGLEPHQDLGGRLGQALAGPDQERHAGPSPRIDVQPHRGERLDLRVGLDALLPAIADVLAAHHVVGLERADRRRTFTFSSRMPSGELAPGGSIASIETTWSMWFWITSRIAPASS